jgi:chemotaxis protein methyltransferase CheR
MPKFPAQLAPAIQLNTELSDSHFQIIREFLSLQCGIVLNESKHYLVKNRLIALLDKFGLNSFTELTNGLQTNSASHNRLKAAVIDAMTTNETFWFRDEKQFAVLKDKILPELLNQRSRPLKIWSAACSSGQEPYSISMTALQIKANSVQIIGTDISETMLAEARTAVYSDLAVSRGIDTDCLTQFFQKKPDGYHLNRPVKLQVSFQQFNLLNNFNNLGLFDIIFCRNVLIYFSEANKRDILSRMANNLEAGGYLFLSSTEAMPTELSIFERVQGNQISYYRKTST